jgi:pyrroloquinoline quinone (PQQ) biosynthesis protein C
MDAPRGMKALLAIRSRVLARLKETSSVRRLFDPASQSLLEIYVGYLSRVVGQYTPHSPKVMALAASRCADTHPELGAYLLRHALEEQGHDEWARQDLRALGVAETAIRAAQPVVSCTAMIGYTYYIAGHSNPVGLFGWMYVLEAIGSDFGAEAAALLKQRLPGSNDAVRFISGHGVADETHAQELSEQIERHILEREDRAEVQRVAAVTGELYVRMFEEIG